MARRTKHEMEQMKSEVRLYLFRTNNKPQPAFELMVKECLESGQSIPYYIKNNKDFIKVSQELALELNRVDQMAKRDREQVMAKESVINYILNLSVNEIKSIYKKYKDNVSQSHKLILNEMYMMIYSNDMKEEYINQATINLFSNIIEQESNVEEIAVTEVVEEESIIEEATEESQTDGVSVNVIGEDVSSIVKNEYRNKLINNNNQTQLICDLQNINNSSQIKRTQVNNNLLQDSG